MDVGDRRRDCVGDFHILPDEIICTILGFLEPREVGILACASSVFHIFCNEEPLWMHFCLETHEGPLIYKDSWKWTTLVKLHLVQSPLVSSPSLLRCTGFSSLFLYRRWCRCHMNLESFSLDNGQIDRRKGMASKEFKAAYDGQKPVLLTDLTEGWLARQSWTLEKLVEMYGNVSFKVSQSHGQAIFMTLKDYATYMMNQYDEEPLYIFDSKFGEAAPGLVKDYKVPTLFGEDLLAILDGSKRPPYRWLVLGPPRSGASWHVDPGLTSAWNALLTGRKRWALYPPGRVPPAVVVHIDDEDGDVHYEGPTSLQWWLDVYPFLKDEDKPIECTQLPGETIFVPSGWWHCVLNLDNSIAVTQNFVNSRNLELFCLDMVPNHHIRAITRAGPLGFGEGYLNTTYQGTTKDWAYDVKALAMHSKISLVSQMHENKYLGRSELRYWLRSLWISRPDLRKQIWRCACFSLDAGTWLQRVLSICHVHGFSLPVDEEKLPVTGGRNMVYMVGDFVIKLYLDEHEKDEAFLAMSSEVLFQSQIHQTGSPLRSFVPTMVAAGVIFHRTAGYEAVPLDIHIPSQASSVDGMNTKESQLKMGTLRLRARWSPDIFSTNRSVQNILYGQQDPVGMMDEQVWPYIVTKACKGEDLAECQSKMTKEDFCILAMFLGEQVKQLHSLPLPFSSQNHVQAQNNLESCYNSTYEYHSKGSTTWANTISTIWDVFLTPVRKLRSNVKDRIYAWGSMPHHFIQELEDYLPVDPVFLLGRDELLEGVPGVGPLPVWLHMDLMGDNIKLEPYSCQMETCDLDILTKHDEGHILSQLTSCFGISTTITSCKRVMQPSCILDFGDVSLGDPLYDFVLLYINVFKCDEELFKVFLKSYGVTFSKDQLEPTKSLSNGVFSRTVMHYTCPSYRAMCYCLLHKYDAMGEVFKMRKELKNTNSLEELEKQFWGFLNQFSDPAWP